MLLNLFGILTAAIFLLLCLHITADAVSDALQICAKSLMPILFPFFVVTNLFMQLDYANTISRLTEPFMSRIFHLPGISSIILVTGFISGYPIGAQATATLYAQ